MSGTMLPSISSLMIEEKEIEEEEGEYIVEKERVRDVGEINVSGRLTFDAEANPDLETRENTEYNSKSYIFNDSIVEVEHHHTKRVTLNTCTANVDVSKYELNFIQESAEYSVSTCSRTVIVGYSGDVLSTQTLQWTMGKFINNNDTLVVVEVIPLSIILKRGVGDHYVKHSARFEKMKGFNLNKFKMRLVYQVNIGNPKYHLDKTIREYEGDLFVMGFSGSKRSKLGGLLSEDQSMEKHFLTNGKVPIVMVSANVELETEMGIGEDIYNESTFVDKVQRYPSLYNPDTVANAQKIEQVNGSANSSDDGGRTSRFLRASRTMARSVSRNTSEVTPVSSSSPLRNLSPFGGLFKRSK